VDHAVPLSAHPDGLVVGDIPKELGLTDSNLSHHAPLDGRLAVNFIDTADSNAPEVSERLIADALHSDNQSQRCDCQYRL
jgi:hypothetical protein